MHIVAIYFENNIKLVTADISGMIILWKIMLDSNDISLTKEKILNFPENIRSLIHISYSPYIIIGGTLYL